MRRYLIIWLSITILLLSISEVLYGQKNDRIPDTLSTYILTPKVSDAPRINGAKVFGARPGSPVLYTIPATGKRPMTFAVEHLPKGLKLDASTGRITGRIPKQGEYAMTLIAQNEEGTSRHSFRIIVGDGIALTPPMGWNSWNCWANEIDEEKVMEAARAMVEIGLVNYGWQYINIDDGWQGIRGGKYNAIQPNSKFPDMKDMIDRLHNMGLKVGIYSSPWVGTFAGHIGSYADRPDGTYSWINDGRCNAHYRFVDPEGKEIHTVNYHHGPWSFVENDVRQWNEWGIDYLKYDWSPNSLYHVKEMRDALSKQKRDVVFSLSNSSPYASAPQWSSMTNCWRTTADIQDNWRSINRIGFNQFKWGPYVKPGHWADADMLVLGMVG